MAHHYTGTRASSSRESSTRQSSSSSRTTKRFYKLREEPLGWWPGGLLPLLGLLLLFLWGVFRIAPDMERATQAGVEDVLQTAGYTGLDVVADGQHVQVKAQGAATDAAQIERIARGTTCDTWIASDLICPTRVAVALDEVARANHNFSFVRNATQTILRGDVPDEQTRNTLLAAARTRLGEVTDSMRVTGERAKPDYSWALDKAWDFLGQVTAGRINWTDGVLSASGRTQRANEDAIRSGFASPQFPDKIGELTLLFDEEVDRCNEAFQAQLQQSVIRFQTGSAVIEATSRPLLAQLAEMAATCPGELIVEGHTDNVGDAAMNLGLSQQRAQSVLEALIDLNVPPGRLTARGFGETQPRASNSTSIGRAQNRRIEIRVADF